MSNEKEAWERAIDRFTAAYGSEPELDVESDRGPFLEILEAEVRRDLEIGLAQSIQAGADRIRVIGAEIRR